MQEDKELQQQPSATQARVGLTSGIVSCVFACLNVIMFICTGLSVHYVQSLQATVDGHTPYVDVFSPYFEQNGIGIGEGENLAQLFLVIEGVAILVAIVSRHVGLAMGRRSGNRNAMRLGNIGLVAGYLSIMLGFGSCCSWLYVLLWRIDG